MVHHKKYLFFTIDLDLKVKVTWKIAQYSLHHVTYTPAKFEVAIPNGERGDAFIRKKIHYLTYDFGVKVTQSIAQ